MTLHQHALGAIALLCAAPVLANVPIESRGLSQNGAAYSQNTPAAYSSSNNAADSAPVTTNLNWQLMQKNQQLENDIRALRGKMEEQDNEIAQLKSELTNRYADLDQRLEMLHQKVEPTDDANAEDNQQDTAPSSTTSPPAAVKSANTAPPLAPAKPAAAVPPAAAKPAVQPAIVSTQPASPAELDKAAYTVALDAYKQGGAKKAIAPMQNFIKNNPNSVYISNAHFWLAEFNLAIDPTNYAEAKRNYAVVANKYPNSARASRALYQLYSIAKDVDHNAAQAAQYKQKLLKSYPQSEEAKYFK